MDFDLIKIILWGVSHPTMIELNLQLTFVKMANSA